MEVSLRSCTKVRCSAPDGTWSTQGRHAGKRTLQLTYGSSLLCSQRVLLQVKGSHSSSLISASKRPYVQNLEHGLNTEPPFSFQLKNSLWHMAGGRVRGGAGQLETPQSVTQLTRQTPSQSQVTQTGLGSQRLGTVTFYR